MLDQINQIINSLLLVLTQESLLLILTLTLQALAIGIALSILLSFFYKDFKLSFRNMFSMKNLFVNLPIIVLMEEGLRVICLSMFSFFLSVVFQIPFWTVTWSILVFAGIIDALLHQTNIEKSTASGAIAYFFIHFVLGAIFTIYLMTYGFFFQIAIHYLYDLFAISIGYALMKIFHKEEEYQEL